MTFNYQAFLDAELAVQVHALVAWLALFTGLYVFSRRKGTRLHKQMGKAWVGMMAIVALSSFFIHGLRTWGLFSPLHLLSIFTLGSLVFAIWAVRNGHIRAHKFAMLGMFIGGLVVTGVLTFANGLLMHRIFIANGVGDTIPAPSEFPGGLYGFVFFLFGLVFASVFAVSIIGQRRANG